MSTRLVVRASQSDALALPGDTTANLLWRIQNGELPIAAPPKAVVIMIGTNDIGYTEACFRSEADNTAAALGISARCKPYHICRHLGRMQKHADTWHEHPAACCHAAMKQLQAVRKSTCPCGYC